MISNSNFTIHPLASGDIGLCRALNAMFGEAFNDEGHYVAKPPGDAHLERLLAKGT